MSKLLFLAFIAHCGLNAADQATHAVENQPPTTAVFSEAFNRLWQASSEPEPFRSIRGDYDPTCPGWWPKDRHEAPKR